VNRLANRYTRREANGRTDRQTDTQRYRHRQMDR